MTKFFFDMCYGVGTVMIIITRVDIVMESITLQCNILLLHLYFISFLLLSHDEWIILKFNTLFLKIIVKNSRYEEFILNIIINQIT